MSEMVIHACIHTNAVKANLNGVVSRGVKGAYVDDSGHLILVLTDDTTVDVGSVIGPEGPEGPEGPIGPRGYSGVYVGPGDMPEGYNVQIDPEGDNTSSLGDMLTSQYDPDDAVRDAGGIAAYLDAGVGSHIGDKNNPHEVTAAQAGADPSGTAASAVSTHNSSSSAHSALFSAKAETREYTVSVGTSWTESGDYYAQTVSVAGILASDNPIVDVVLGTDADANAAYLAAWSAVQRITTAANAITFYATGEPQSAFSALVKVVR